MNIGDLHHLHPPEGFRQVGKLDRDTLDIIIVLIGKTIQQGGKQTATYGNAKLAQKNGPVDTWTGLGLTGVGTGKKDFSPQPLNPPAQVVDEKKHAGKKLQDKKCNQHGEHGAAQSFANVVKIQVRQQEKQGNHQNGENPIGQVDGGPGTGCSVAGQQLKNLEKINIQNNHQTAYQEPKGRTTHEVFF